MQEGYINFEDQNTGLLSGHAYSIIDVIELDYLEDEKPLKKNKHGCHRLLRIRNPWGYGEWKLKCKKKKKKIENIKSLIEFKFYLKFRVRK